MNATSSPPAGVEIPIDPVRDPSPLHACVPDDPTIWHRIAEIYVRIQSITGHACVPAPGSIAGVCLSCDCKIWIGPAQQNHPDLLTLCLVCALAVAVEGAEITALGKDGEPRTGVNFEGRNP